MLTTSSPQTTTHIETNNLIYIVHHNGIHEVIAKASRRAYVDDLILILVEKCKAGQIQGTVAFLYDLQVGIPPVAYMMQRSRQLMAISLSSAITRNAILFKDNLALSLVMPYMNLFPNFGRLSMDFFQYTEREKAIAWLLG